MTTTLPEVLQHLSKLFDSIGENKYQQEFECPKAARKFAEGMREQVGDFVDVEQRPGRVVMTIL